MKRFLFLMALVTSCCFVRSQEATVTEIKPKVLQIFELDSTEFNYIIYAGKKDSVLKIVSRKIDSLTCERIEVGKSYPLQLVSALHGVVKLASPRHIAGIKLNGEVILIDGPLIHWDIFIAENLQGLCLKDTFE
jgi:hypothetical protein